MENLTTDPETLAAAASVAAPSTSTTSPASNMEVDENNKESPTNKASTSAPGKFSASFEFYLAFLENLTEKCGRILCVKLISVSVVFSASGDNKATNTAMHHQIKQIKPLLSVSSRLGRALVELFALLVKLCVGSPLRQRRGQQIPGIFFLQTLFL